MAIPSNPRIPFRTMHEAPRLPPPDGRPLIVHVVVNIEHWPFDKPMPRALWAAPHGKQPWPDLANFGWVEYGLRMGLPRLQRVLDERELPASATMNASVIDVYPQCAQMALDSAWEIVGHGFEQRSLALEDDEVAVIGRTVEALQRFTGRRPRGWLGPGFGETTSTPEHLKAAGFDHLYDWAIDDVPCWMTTAIGPLVAMPYALELNDVAIFLLGRMAGSAYFDAYRDWVETVEPELAAQPRVLTLGLHPHIVAVPQRLKHLARLLDFLLARDDTIFMRSSEIADWFLAHSPPPGH